MSEESKEPGKWARLRSKRWFRWTTDILFFALILGGAMAYQTWHHVDRGEAAPLFALQTLDGTPMSSDDLMGKPSVLFFWAPWCGVCEADAHNIADLREAVGDEVHIVSVALSYESVDSVESFVEDNGVTGPVLMGNRGTSRDFRIDSFPTVYILDEEGRVTNSIVGYTTEFGLRARLAMLGIF